MPRRTASSPPGELPEAAATEVAQRPEYRVEALAKGLRILSLFDERRPSWRLSDLAAAAGLPMPTVYRVVMTLAAEGYLDQLPDGGYRPGVRTLTPRADARRARDLLGDLRVADRFLTFLSRQPSPGNP
jgi:IclR family pca regulon transcriptional regulator